MYSTLREVENLSHSHTERRLPYGITQRYLPLDIGDWRASH